MSKFNERFFCPCPWESMYYHIDQPSPCHLIRHGHNFTPKEYLDSDWLKTIKTQFVNGEIPPYCQTSCKEREDRGLKSTRGAAWGFFNDREYPEIDISKFTLEEKTKIKRLELRTTNLCNFKCRMCTEDSSSEIAKEKQFHGIPVRYTFSDDSEKSIQKTNDDNLNELKELLLDDLKTLCFTGGEPLLIKQYYDFMDFLIEKGLSNKINLEVYTNCSVYNKEFIDRMNQFKKVEFVMSIDGVGRTAEYQRSGTKWDVVNENIQKFVVMTKDICITTAITSYVLLDASSLAKYLMLLYNENNSITSKCYTVNSPRELHYNNLDGELREKAILELGLAIDILTGSGYNVIRTEFIKIKNSLENSTSKNYLSFVEHTKKMDKMRNESFQEVFGYILY